MHIADGVLSAPVLVGGGVLAAAGLAVGFRRMDDNDMPKVALLTAAYFIASTIHVPIGPASAHLALNGFLGLILGWKAVPAICIALILQTVLFRHGGITTLGVNTVIMALPAVMIHALCGPWLRRVRRRNVIGLIGFAAGVGGILLAALLAATTLTLTGKEWQVIARLLIGIHVPVMIVEGVITAALIQFIATMKPQLLDRPASA